MYYLYFLKFPNNKLYVGITSNFKQRLSQHKYEADKGNKNKIYNAIRKYGWNNVQKELSVINLSKEEAVTLEMDIIQSLNLLKDGYNTSPGGSIPNENIANITKNRMQEPEFRNIALTALHSNEEKRLATFKTKEYRKRISDIAKKRVAEGKCKLPIIRKPIVCIETGETFDSITAAAVHFGGQRNHLRDHLKGKKERPRFKGLHFEYLKEEAAA